MCSYGWNGSSWDLILDNCPSGKHCVAPTGSGFWGELRQSPCE